MLAGYRSSSWNPFLEMEKLQNDINHLFSGYSTGRGNGSWPPVRLYGSDEGLVLLTEVPGMESDQINISSVGRNLTLSMKPRGKETEEGVTYHRRERSWKPFSRTLELPFKVNTEKIEAQCKNGMLLIRLPRAEEDKPRTIKIAKN